MIKGNSKTEATYRAVNLDSSSSLKDFSMDRKKYFKKYILGESVEDKDNQAAIMGRIVETLLLEPEEFDKRFYMSSCISAPTAMMLDFVEALYRISKQATNEEGVITRSFEDISKEAYAEAGYKIKYEAVISKFIGSDAELYYREICKVRQNNLTVVTTNDVTYAERIVEELRTNFVTKDVVNLITSVKYDVLNQFQVEGYEVDGHKFKSMMDKVVVDHEERKIHIYDLKCTWSVENFIEEYYLYRRAYIQGFLYYKGIEAFTKDASHEWYGYEVLPTKFIVCDSTNYYNPLIYQMSEEDLQKAYDGFERKGRTYPGVGDIIKDLKWATENNVWNISRENYLSNGLVKLIYD